MPVKIFISIVVCFCIQTVHSNFLFAQKPNKKDTLQVLVDDHTMSMYVSGHGKYTVVLEAGGSSNHRCYRTIDTALAKFTRVISYDRPGYLKSDTCRKTRDAITIARELKEALSTGGYPPPYILAGWSMGGSFAKVFCGLYPSDVAGLVLIDPCPEDVYARMEKEHPELMKEDSVYMQEILTSTDRPGEREEMRAFDRSMQQAKISDKAHSIPTTLLIAAYGKVPGDGEKDPNNPMNFMWVEELKKWAAKRSNVQYTILSSGHHIAKEHPGIVVKAITDMIEKLK